MAPDLFFNVMFCTAAAWVGLSFTGLFIEKSLLETFERERPDEWAEAGSPKLGRVPFQSDGLTLLRVERLAWRWFRTRPDWVGPKLDGNWRWFRFLFALRYFCVLPFFIIGFGVELSRMP